MDFYFELRIGIWDSGFRNCSSDFRVGSWFLVLNCASCYEV